MEGKKLKPNAREIRSYDYVNHAYDRVRDLLRRDAVAVFQAATQSAVSRAQSVATELHVDFAGVGVKADINVRVNNIEEKNETSSTAITRLLLEWQAATMPGMFPVMKAELSVYPLTATETQLDFLGQYEPPFGALGKP